jgi:hypothetical protein
MSIPTRAKANLAACVGGDDPAYQQPIRELFSLIPCVERSEQA